MFNLKGSIFMRANAGREVFKGGGPVTRAHPFNARWGRRNRAHTGRDVRSARRWGRLRRDFFFALGAGAVRVDCELPERGGRENIPAAVRELTARQLGMKNHALSHFRRPPERLNCAQAVVLAYQEVSGDTAIPVSSMKPCGGGRAPGGLCGALHAVCVIAPDKAESLKARFAELAGSVLCEEIRRAKQYSCDFCVAEAAQLLEHEWRAPGAGPLPGRPAAGGPGAPSSRP